MVKLRLPTCMAKLRAGARDSDFEESDSDSDSESDSERAITNVPKLMYVTITMKFLLSNQVPFCMNRIGIALIDACRAFPAMLPHQY